MAKSKHPKIDREFRDFMPPIGDAAFADLRQSIVDHGVLSPLVVWEENGLLLDGYNRLRVCIELKMKYPIKVLSFKNRAEALAWIASNQLARRNLTPLQISYYRGKEYLALKQVTPFETAPANWPSGQNAPPIENSDFPEENATSNYERASEKVAEKYGVAESTVRRDAVFAEAVDASPEKAAVIAGKSDKTKKQIIEAKPNYCQRCTRVGPTKNCAACAQMGVKPKPSKPAKPIKPGAPLFDFVNYEFHFVKVAQAPDMIARAYPDEKGTYEYRESLDLLQRYAAVFAAWKKRITASGG